MQKFILYAGLSSTQCGMMDVQIILIFTTFLKFSICLQSAWCPKNWSRALLFFPYSKHYKNFLGSNWFSVQITAFLHVCCHRCLLSGFGFLPRIQFTASFLFLSPSHSLFIFCSPRIWVAPYEEFGCLSRPRFLLCGPPFLHHIFLQCLYCMLSFIPVLAVPIRYSFWIQSKVPGDQCSPDLLQANDSSSFSLIISLEYSEIPNSTKRYQIAWLKFFVAHFQCQ